MKGFIKTRALYIFLAVMLLVSVLPLGILPIVTSSQPVYAAPADAYWVGNSGTWSDAANHWANVSGGAPSAGNLPDLTTNTHFDDLSFNTSGQTVTVSSSTACNAMDWSLVTNSPTFTGTSTLTVYGDVVFANMSVTNTNFTLTFRKAGTQHFRTNGVTTQLKVKCYGASNYLILDDALTCYSTDFSSGASTFDTNNMSMTITTSFGGAQTDCKYILGSSTVTCGAVVIPTGKGIIWANTSSIICTDTASQFRGNAQTFYDVTFTGANPTMYSDSGSCTFHNLSIIGNAVKTGSFSFLSGATQTITGSLNISGNSATNRILVWASAFGSTATINVDGDWTGTQNVDFQDITATHAIDLSAITGLAGDCGGNSNITLTAMDTCTWQYAGSGAWSNVSNWDTAVATDRVPLPQDDVSFALQLDSGVTVTVDMPRIGANISLAGMTDLGTDPIFSLSNDISNYGSYTLVSAITYTHNNKTNYFSSRGSSVIDCAGKTLYLANIYAPSGTYILSGDFYATNLYITFGSFNSSIYNVNIAYFTTDYYPNVRALDMGSGNWRLTVTATGSNKWLFPEVTTGFTFNANTSTLTIIQGGTSGEKWIRNGGVNTAWYDVVVNGSSTGAVGFNYNASFHSFTIDRSQANKTITFGSGYTYTFSDFTCATSSTRTVTIQASTTATIFNKTGGGIVVIDYITLSQNTGLPVSTWYYDVHNTIGAGVTNWNLVNYYTLSVVADPVAGGVPTFTGSSPFIINSVVPIQANTDPCYTFTGWTPVDDIADPSLEDTTVIMTANKSLTANFAIISYNLTTASDAHGSVTNPGEGVYAYNCSDVVDIEATADPCYEFVNWTGDTGGIANVNDPTTTITISANASITANFTLATYDLTTASDAHGSVTNPGEGVYTYNCSEVVDIEATADACYHFVNWTGDTGDIADVNDSTTTITMNSDASITANFAIDVFVLTYSAGAHGAINGSSPQNVNCGGDGTPVTAEADPCYHFVNWSDSSTDNPRTDTNVLANISVTANFAIDVFNLTTTSDTHGNVSIPGEGIYPYNCGEIVNISATADSCYHFVNWTGDTGGILDINSSATTITMTANASITANFAITTYTLSVIADPIAGGTPTFDGSSPFNCSDVVVIHAGTNPCWGFTGWTPVTGINDSTLEDAELTITGNTVLTAHYDSNMVLTLSSGDGGDVTTPSEGIHNYNCSDVVALVATPDAFYNFLNWTGDVTEVDDVNDPTTNVTMNGSYNIKANFAIVGGLYPPTNLSVTMTSGACFNMTWTMGINASSTIMVICPDAPHDCSDTDFGNLSTGCYILYNGSGSAFSSDYCGLDLNSYNYYITAWSSNGSGYSPVCASITIGGGDMVDALYTGLAAFIALGLSAIGFWQKKTWVFLLAGMAWVGFGIWELTSGASGTLYWYFGWLGLVAGLVMFLAPAWNWKKDKSKTFLDDDEEYSRQIDKETGKTKKED